MTVRWRPYADEDLPRLESALAGWIRDAGPCGYCHAGALPHRIYEQRLPRPAAELVQVYEDGWGVVGLAINVRFGTAFDVFTAPPLRGTDAELAMLSSAREVTGRHVDAGTPVTTDVHRCDAVRQDLLTRLGFEQYRIWDHITERNLSEPLPEPHLPPGFTFRPATHADAEQLASVRNHAFGGGTDWTGPTYRDEVMTKPGYDPDRELVVVAPTGQLAALTILRLDELNRVGQLEPVATDPPFHRRGLACAMLLHALAELHGRGMRTATIEHAADNPPRPPALPHPRLHQARRDLGLPRAEQIASQPERGRRPHAQARGDGEHHARRGHRPGEGWFDPLNEDIGQSDITAATRELQAAADALLVGRKKRWKEHRAAT